MNGSDGLQETRSSDCNVLMPGCTYIEQPPVIEVLDKFVNDDVSKVDKFNIEEKDDDDGDDNVDDDDTVLEVVSFTNDK